MSYYAYMFVWRSGQFIANPTAEVGIIALPVTYGAMWSCGVNLLSSLGLEHCHKQKELKTIDQRKLLKILKY